MDHILACIFTVNVAMHVFSYTHSLQLMFSLFSPFRMEEKILFSLTLWWHLPGPAPSWTPACTKMFLEPYLAHVSEMMILKTYQIEQSVSDHLCLSCLVAASPHTSSTPNINSVRHADSRGSLISTDSANSLSERNHDKSNSLDKVLSLLLFLADVRMLRSF